MIRPEEMAAGRIDHALFMVVKCTAGRVYPALGGGSQCADRHERPGGRDALPARPTATPKSRRSRFRAGRRRSSMRSARTAPTSATPAVPASTSSSSPAPPTRASARPTGSSSGRRHSRESALQRQVRARSRTRRRLVAPPRNRPLRHQRLLLTPPAGPLRTPIMAADSRSHDRKATRHPHRRTHAARRLLGVLLVRRRAGCVILVATSILARLLTPEDFGVVGLRPGLHGAARDREGPGAGPGAGRQPSAGRLRAGGHGLRGGGRPRRAHERDRGRDRPAGGGLLRRAQAARHRARARPELPDPVDRRDALRARPEGDALPHAHDRRVLRRLRARHGRRRAGAHGRGRMVARARLRGRHDRARHRAVDPGAVAAPPAAARPPAPTGSAPVRGSPDGRGHHGGDHEQRRLPVRRQGARPRRPGRLHARFPASRSWRS